MSEEISVGMGQYRVVKNPARLTCVGLGSCVALVLYDEARKVGAVAHIMLPSRTEAKNPSNAGKFADSCVDLLVRAMERWGSTRRHLKAKLFGGADMFPSIRHNFSMRLGLQNVEAVRSELARRRIQVVAEEVGGQMGRTILFDSEDGRVTVRDVRGSERVY